MSKKSSGGTLSLFIGIAIAAFILSKILVYLLLLGTLALLIYTGLLLYQKHNGNEVSLIRLILCISGVIILIALTITAMINAKNQKAEDAALAMQTTEATSDPETTTQTITETTTETTTESTTFAYVIETTSGDVDEISLSKNTNVRSQVVVLYSELTDTYVSQKSNYDATAWAEYMREFSTKIQDASVAASTDVSLRTAIGDMQTLALEYGKDLQGKDNDIDYFKKSVDSVIQDASNTIESVTTQSQQSNATSTSTVYFTPSGKSYHSTSSCRTLARSKNILSGTLQDAIDGGHSDPCDVCN